MSLPLYEEVARRLRGGRKVAVATVVERVGSAPRAFGAKMLVGDDGSTAFSIGGGAFEALVIEDAREALRSGRGFEKDYRFTEAGFGATGMVCGGTVRVLVEVLTPPAPLLIFGAGHVGRELAHLAVRLDFAVTVVDDRARELAEERFPPEVVRLRVEPEYGAGLPEVPVGGYVAILTRCHRTDLLAARHAVGRGAAYVGLIGSRRKVATVVSRAVALGTPREDLEALRAPIGLPIGAETPAEIAVSILAEMVNVRRGGPAPHMSDRLRERFQRRLRAKGSLEEPDL
jgi:xanthine dehydrogenase accessory factor